MNTNIIWQCVHFDQLSASDLYDILSARSAVFMVEQNCVYHDMDNKDKVAWHVMGWINGDNNDQNGTKNAPQLAAYCRLLPPNCAYKEVSIGRVLSTKATRKTGAGRQLMEQAIAQLNVLYPQNAIRISAQSYLLDFYGSFGFKVASPEYLEDNIPHTEMLRPAD